MQNRLNTIPDTLQGLVNQYLPSSDLGRLVGVSKKSQKNVEQEKEQREWAFNDPLAHGLFEILLKNNLVSLTEKGFQFSREPLYNYCRKHPSFADSLIKNPHIRPYIPRNELALRFFLSKWKKAKIAFTDFLALSTGAILGLQFAALGIIALPLCFPLFLYTEYIKNRDIHGRNTVSNLMNCTGKFFGYIFATTVLYPILVAIAIPLTTIFIFCASLYRAWNMSKMKYRNLHHYLFEALDKPNITNIANPLNVPLNISAKRKDDYMTLADLAATVKITSIKNPEARINNTNLIINHQLAKTDIKTNEKPKAQPPIPTFNLLEECKKLHGYKRKLINSSALANSDATSPTVAPVSNLSALNR